MIFFIPHKMSWGKYRFFCTKGFSRPKKLRDASKFIPPSKPVKPITPVKIIKN